MRIRTKICCIASPEEARMAIEAGATSVIQPGGTAKLRLTIAPEEGWHVYPWAETMPDSGVRPTLIAIGDTTRLKITRPEADSEIITKDDQQYHVGTTTWTIDVPIPADAPSGMYAIDGLLGYQICSDSSCKSSAADFRAIITVGEETKDGSTPVSFDDADYVQAIEGLETQVGWLPKANSLTLDYAAINDQSSKLLSAGLCLVF